MTADTRPSIDDVIDIRDAAEAYAAHLAEPSADCEPIFRWNRALERLTPGMLAELCDVWLLVEGDSAEAEQAYCYDASALPNPGDN